MVNKGVKTGDLKFTKYSTSDDEHSHTSGPLNRSLGLNGSVDPESQFDNDDKNDD